MSLPLVKYVLLAALRDRLVLSMVVILFVGTSLAIFLGNSAVIEKNYFAVIFAAAGLRFMSVVGLVLFVVFFVRRSFEGKDIEYFLSRPIGRLKMLFSYAAAFSILAVFMGAAVGFAVYGVSPNLYGDGHQLWIASIIVENIIMVNTALFFSMYISSSATASLVTFSFYTLARMMGQLLGITDSSMVDNTGVYAMALQLVSAITPRLDLMGQTSWLIYGVDNNLVMLDVFIQGAAFSFLVLMAASLDLVRRQF